MGEGETSGRPDRLYQNRSDLGRMNIAVLGAGAWGTALAICSSARHRVTLWTRNVEHLAELAALRTNQRYLPRQPLPDSIHLVSALSEALERAELVLSSYPLQDYAPLCSRWWH